MSVSGDHNYSKLLESNNEFLASTYTDCRASILYLTNGN